MAVDVINENEIKIFVNKAWAKATGKVKVGKIELEIGKTAFATIEDAAKAVKAADAVEGEASTAGKPYEVVVLDSKAVIDDKANDLFAREGKVEITSNTEGKVKGTLEVTKDASKAEIDGFANVTVGADAFVGTVKGTLEKEDYYKVKGVATTVKSESAAAAGKIEIAAKGTLVTNGTDITKYGADKVVGYKTVNVADGATVKEISANVVMKDGSEVNALEFSKKYSDKVVYTEEGKAVGDEVVGKSLITDAQVKTTGAVTVNKATVGSIKGYKTVTLNDEAKVTGAIEGIKGAYKAEKVTNRYEVADGKVKTVLDTDWDGEFDVKDGGTYTNVKVSNGIKLDAEKETVSGSTTVTESDVKGGTLKVGKAVVDGAISGFDKVTLADGADVEGVTNDAIDKVTRKATYKTSGKDEKVYTGKYDVTKTSAISGSFTATNATIGKAATTDTEFDGAAITGFKTVKLTGSNAGAIIGSVDSKVTAKYAEEFDALYNEAATARFFFDYDESKLTYEKDDKNITVDLTKFADWTAEDKNAVKEALNAKKAGLVDNVDRIFVKDGKIYVLQDGVAPGADLEVNATNFKFPVDENGNQLQNPAKTGIMTWAELMFGKEDFEFNDVDLTSYQEKTSVTGSVTVAVDKKTPKAVEVDAISNYSKVTLTGAEAKTADAGNIMVTTKGISGAATYTNTIKKGYKDNADKKTITGTDSYVIKNVAAGSLKASHANINGKVTDFKTVTFNDVYFVTGANLTYKNGRGTFGANYSGSTKFVWSVKEKGGTAKQTDVISSSMAGSFTATYSDISGYGEGSISGYATVKLTDNYHAGDITGYTTDKQTLKTTNTFETYENAVANKSKSVEYEQVTTNKAAGKVTVKATKNVDTDEEFRVGAISNYKAVDIAGIEIKGKKKEDPSTLIVINTKALTGAMNTEEKIKYDVAYTYNTDSTVTVNTTLEKGEKWNFKKETAVASAKVTNADVNGGITNFAKVALKNVDVTGDVTTGNTMTTYKWESATEDPGKADDFVSSAIEETFKSVVGDLSMEDADITGAVSGFKTVNVKSGLNKFDHYTGLAKGTATNGSVAKDDKDAIETIKIAKKATLVTKYLDLQADDKLTVDGELVFAGADADVAKLAGAVSEIKGKGAIFASNSDWAKITASFNGDKVKLGYTAKNFKGVEAELADNDQQNAVAWREAKDGWLGRGVTGDFVFGNVEADKGDVVDYIKFETAGEYTITLDKDTAWTDCALTDFELNGATGAVLDGNEITFEVAAGAVVGFGIKKEGQSISYTITQG